jgi:hypothetical protein
MFDFLGSYLVEAANDGSSYRICLQPPRWLMERLWKFELQRAYSGWQMNFRRYDVVSTWPINLLTCIEDGDLQGLLSLFERREVTPFVVDEGGWTLLHVSVSIRSTRKAIFKLTMVQCAVNHAQPRICHKLLELGLNDCITMASEDRW